MRPATIATMTASARGRLRALRAATASWGRVLRTVLGAPGYDGYLVHTRARHPGTRVMTRDEFVAARLRARYERPGSRCC